MLFALCIIVSPLLHTKTSHIYFFFSIIKRVNNENEHSLEAKKDTSVHF